MIRVRGKGSAAWPPPVRRSRSAFSVYRVRRPSLAISIERVLGGIDPPGLGGLGGITGKEVGVALAAGARCAFLICVGGGARLQAKLAQGGDVSLIVGIGPPAHGRSPVDYEIVSNANPI